MWNLGGEEISKNHDPVWKEIDSICRLRGLEQQQLLPSDVADSWKRCLTDYKLSPDCVPRAEIVTHSELRNLIQSREELLRVAEPEVERLFLQLVDSDYMVSLASPQGVMMLFRCDYQYLGDFANSGVLPGSVWSEERQGTNGVGTCLRLGKSVSIVGSQHYGIATQALTCITAPVFGSMGAIDGVLNVTTSRGGDARMNRVVQGIVDRAARRIENGHFGQIHRKAMVLRLLERSEGSDLADEARLAVDDSGRIIDATTGVSRVLGIAAANLIGSTTEELLDIGSRLENLPADRPFKITVEGKTVEAVLNVPRGRLQTSALGSNSIRMPENRPSFPAVKITPFGASTGPYISDPITSLLVDRGTRLLSAGLALVITGETGSGKTFLAATIARLGLGEDTELVFIDCAALKGEQGINDVFQACAAREKVCVVLDRFECLDEENQSLLLGLLEAESHSEHRPNRMGIIAATSIDMQELSQRGKLRSELMHRLRGGSIVLPPLRKHPELAETIKAYFDLEKAAAGKPGLVLDEDSQLVLRHYHWPGNLRELRNCLRHAIALSEGKHVRMDHLPEDIVNEIARKDLTARSQSESSRIEAALRHNSGNVTLTARYLGISRATLYRKIQIQQMREEA